MKPREPERDDPEWAGLKPELQRLMQAVGPKLYPFRSAGIVRKEQRQSRPAYAVS